MSSKTKNVAFKVDNTKKVGERLTLNAHKRERQEESLKYLILCLVVMIILIAGILIFNPNYNG